MKRMDSFFACVVLAVTIGTGCGDDGGGGADAMVTDMPDASGEVPDAGAGDVDAPAAGMLSHAVDIQPIWAASCSAAGCHGATAASGLDLQPANAYASLVGTPSREVPAMNRVTAGDPTMSYVWHKLNNTQGTVDGSGTQMPPTGGMLSAEDLDKIMAWIDQGAPE